MFSKLTNDISSKARLSAAFILSFLFIYPIYSSGVYYIDDLERSQNAISGWTGLGRPLSDFIFYLLSLGNKGSIDVSPLPQIASIVLMAASIYYFAGRMFSSKSVSTIAVSSLVFLNPLFLHNISYRYDSLSMVLSLSFCLYAFSIQSKNLPNRIACKSLLIFGSLCLYQVSAVSFVILLISSLTIKVFNEEKINKRLIMQDLAALSLAYACYSILIKFLITNNRSETIFSDANWSKLLYINISKFEAMYLSSYDRLSIWILGVSFSLASVAFIARTIFSFREKSLENKFFSLASLLAPVFILLASCSTIIILKESLILPRIASSYGVVIFSLVYFIYQINNKCASILSIYLCLSVVLTSFALGATMKSQYEKDMFLAAQIKGVIESDLNLKDNKTTVIGASNATIVETVNSRVFPVIGLINSPMYDNTGSLMLKRLGLQLVNFSFDRKKWIPKALSACQLSLPHADNKSFSIYSEPGQNYVFLGSSGAKCRRTADSISPELTE